MFQFIDKGGPVMYALIVCSIVSLTFIIERLMFWFFDMRNAESDDIDRYLEDLRRGRLKDFLKATQASKNPIALTMARSLAHSGKTLAEALNLEVDSTVEKTRRSLGVIDTCVTLAPLLGIFGTVLGIIKSFEILGMSGITNPHAVSAGIGEALITTAAGLAIAMPSLIFHNLFIAKADKFAFRLERYAREFEILYTALRNKPNSVSSARAAADEMRVN